MSKRKNHQDTPSPEKTAEPVGIVISNGAKEPDAPRFAAYVWGPVPDAEPELVAVA